MLQRHLFPFVNPTKQSGLCLRRSRQGGLNTLCLQNLVKKSTTSLVLYFKVEKVKPNFKKKKIFKLRKNNFKTSWRASTMKTRLCFSVKFTRSYYYLYKIDCIMSRISADFCFRKQPFYVTLF